MDLIMVFGVLISLLGTLVLMQLLEARHMPDFQ